MGPQSRHIYTCYCFSLPSSTTTILGTPAFRAPELIQWKPYDGKVDVWAIGIILYEIVTKRNPFFRQNQTQEELVQRIVSERISYPATFPREIREFVDLLTQKHPNNRPSIEDVLALRYMQ
jgi:serine/threonine protein kinase